MTKTELFKFHDDLEAHMESVFGQKVGIKTGKTFGRSQRLSELKASEAEIGAAVKGVNEMIKHAETIKQARPSSETLTRLANYELSRIPEIEPTEVKKSLFTSSTFVPSRDLDRANRTIRKLHNEKTDALEELRKFNKWAETVWPLDKDHVEFLNKTIRAINYKSRLETLQENYTKLYGQYEKEIKKNDTLDFDYKQKLQTEQNEINYLKKQIENYKIIHADYVKHTGKEWEELPVVKERVETQKLQVKGKTLHQNKQAQLRHGRSRGHGLSR
jgi:CHAT domain-containing protein